MILLIVNLICLILLWLFAYFGIKHYEYSQQDTGMFSMKLLSHVLLIVALSITIYGYIHAERRVVATNSSVAEEIKK
jgi:hypothetical protein